MCDALTAGLLRGVKVWVADEVWVAGGGPVPGERGANAPRTPAPFCERGSATPASVREHRIDQMERPANRATVSITFLCWPAHEGARVLRLPGPALYPRDHRRTQAPTSFLK